MILKIYGALRQIYVEAPRHNKERQREKEKGKKGRGKEGKMKELGRGAGKMGDLKKTPFAFK